MTFNRAPWAFFFVSRDRTIDLAHRTIICVPIYSAAIAIPIIIGTFSIFRSRIMERARAGRRNACTWVIHLRCMEVSLNCRELSPVSMSDSIRCAVWSWAVWFLDLSRLIGFVFSSNGQTTFIRAHLALLDTMSFEQIGSDDWPEYSWTSLSFSSTLIFDLPAATTIILDSVALVMR